MLLLQQRAMSFTLLESLHKLAIVGYEAREKA